jgi:N-acetylglucosaminyldiphosphoundecaprenol N-acetyl-beta-D-mannosaminyltransferase
MKYPYSSYFEYKLFKGKLDTIESWDNLIINTINMYSFCVAENDGRFKKALKESDILLPDGSAVVWSHHFLNKEKIGKIAGADLHDFLLKRLNETRGKCFYLGASNSTLSKIQNRLKKEYPNIKNSFYSPPFKPDFSEEDTLKMIEKVNAFSPDVLFVGLTAPKQEKWINENKHLLNAKVMCAIGAVFDFYGGTIKRPSNFLIGLNLEWFGRFLNEPRRMWKRYFYYGPIFLFKTIEARFIQKQ